MIEKIIISLVIQAIERRGFDLSEIDVDNIDFCDETMKAIDEYIESKEKVLTLIEKDIKGSIRK